MGAPVQLKPTMASRKLVALDFIKRYFAEWGHSPSLDEIAAHLGVSKQRADELVAQLSREHQIRRVKGKKRGLQLVGRGEPVSQADALLRLRELGWSINNASRTVDEAMAPLTNTGLTGLPFLDHDPGCGISPE